MQLQGGCIVDQIKNPASRNDLFWSLEVACVPSLIKAFDGIFFFFQLFYHPADENQPHFTSTRGCFA